jgi:hypothetical protein
VNRPFIKNLQGPIFVLVLGVSLSSSPALALPESHSPFLPDQYNTLVLNICKPVQRNLESVHPARGSVTFVAPGGQRLSFKMVAEIDPYSEKYSARISDSENIILSERELPLIANVVHLLPEEAICDDLNGDGITDFITTHSLHGNGLGARSYDRLIMLSSTDGEYRFWTMRTMDPSPLDFQLLNEPGSEVFLTTSFANSGGDRPHSYLVYDLWRFEGNQLVNANHLDARFPKWVLMTFAENHKPATSLSSEDKLRMLKRRSATEIPSLGSE